MSLLFLKCSILNCDQNQINDFVQYDFTAQ